MWNRWGLALAFLAAAVLVTAGCAGSPWLTYTGRAARPDNRIPLESGGSHAAIWMTGDLALHYTYRWTGQELAITGQVEPQARITHFQVIRHLSVRIHFLDADGIILDTRTLWQPGALVNVDMVKWTFDHRWPLPAETRAIGFSYTGAVQDTSGSNAGDDIGGAVDWEFWYGP
jgi:hypothetical protein